MNTTARFSLSALAATLIVSSAAPVPASAADSQPCTPQEKSNQTLSEKLDQTSGVICPPDIDPSMKAPTPKNGGNMPVIPPPGTPGGDPSVQPK
jgi:hypothetical protein